MIPIDHILLKCCRCKSVYSMIHEEIYFKKLEPWCPICEGKDIEELHDIEEALEFGR